MGSAKSTVLSIFWLLTPQDLRGLADTLRTTQRSQKLAAGAELLVWEEDEIVTAPDAKIIAFPKKEKPSEEHPSSGGNALSQMGVLSAKEQQAKLRAAQEELDKDKPSESDFILEERVKFKESEERIFKQSGYACYQRSSDLSLYRVTVTDDKGKERTRLTSTQGVLVNKKQA